jgi:hypothetical protein
MTVEEQLKSLPPLRADSAKCDVQEAKNHDKVKKGWWKDNKVRMVAECNDCGAPRCIFSMKAIGSKGGPTSEQAKKVQQQIEGGYTCGNTIDVENFAARESIWCGDPVEPQYYWKQQKTRPGIIMPAPPEWCASCYDVDEDNIVPDEEVVQKRNTGGKKFLPICRDCFDANVPVVKTSGNTNFQQKKQQDKRELEKQLDKNVSSGRKRKRRNVGTSDGKKSCRK